METGQFLVTSRVFIDSIDERRFSNVHVLNTQTAFLLADLNETTNTTQQRDNISIYITQQQQQEVEEEHQLSLFHFQTQSSRSYLEAAETENEPIQTQNLRSTRDLFEESQNEIDNHHDDDKTASDEDMIEPGSDSKPTQVYIDETRMEEESESTRHENTKSPSSRTSSPSTNICDRTLGDTSDLIADDKVAIIEGTYYHSTQLNLYMPNYCLIFIV